MQLFFIKIKSFFYQQLRFLKFMKPIICIFFIMFTLVLHADTSKLAFKTTKVNTIHPMSVDRVHCPACSGYTRIYIEDSSSSWGSTNCRADAADIHIDDTHLLSILMLAYSQGKSLKIEVNSTRKIIDEVCVVTALCM